MGNKVMSHPRIVLTGTLMSHFKASDLVRDVVPIITNWQRAGAELCLGRDEFQRTFDVLIDSDAQFASFDTDGNGKVDTYEVLMVYILLSTGDKVQKLEIAFGVFSYLNGSGASPSLNFDEAMMMLGACVRGVSKVCLDAIEITDSEVLYLCQSMYDMHRRDYGKRIQLKQFISWCCEDPSPRSFVQLFHTALELSELRSEVQRRSLEQAAIFQVIAEGDLTVDGDCLAENVQFLQSLADPSEPEVQTLIDLMLDISGQISSERFHLVLRPWNIFNECDLDGSHNLDEKELDILLWFQMRQRQTPEFVRQFMSHLDADEDGCVARLEWVKKVVMAGDLSDKTTENLYEAKRQSLALTDRELRNSLVISELLTSTASVQKIGTVW